MKQIFRNPQHKQINGLISELQTAEAAILQTGVQDLPPGTDATYAKVWSCCEVVTNAREYVASAGVLMVVIAKRQKLGPDELSQAAKDWAAGRKRWHVLTSVLTQLSRFRFCLRLRIVSLSPVVCSKSSKNATCWTYL